MREEAYSCIYALAILFMLGLSKLVHIPGLPRYDFLLILCFLMQGVMIWTKLETLDELKAVCVFHVIGLAMEVYKVRIGSWAYPEAAYSKFSGVPLYSGFMYASVGSYVCQAWKRMDLRVDNWPGATIAVPLAILIYANFFTRHWIIDIRIPLILATLWVFRRTRVEYRIADIRTQMPLGLSFLLIGTCIWMAENAATRMGAWKYPYQVEKWQWVHGEKIGSWGLLVIVTVVVVAQLKLLQAKRKSGASHSAFPC